MEVSTSLNVFNNTPWSYTQIIDAGIEAGFRCFDLNVNDYCYNPDSFLLQENWRENMAGIRDHAKARGVRFYQAHTYIPYPLDVADETRKFLTLRTIEAAGIAGAQWIVVHPWFFNDPFEVSLAKNLEELASFAAFAKQHSIGIAIENMPGEIHFRDGIEKYPFNTAEELIRLIDPLNAEFGNVGACWDTGHAALTLNLAPQRENILRLGKRLKTLHIADNGGSFDDHLPPFYCRVDFKEIVEALEEIGFEGTFNFEAHNCCNKLPTELRIDGARMLYRIGEYIVTHYGKQ